MADMGFILATVCLFKPKEKRRKWPESKQEKEEAFIVRNIWMLFGSLPGNRRLLVLEKIMAAGQMKARNRELFKTESWSMEINKKKRILLGES